MWESGCEHKRGMKGVDRDMKIKNEYSAIYILVFCFILLLKGNLVHAADFPGTVIYEDLNDTYSFYERAVTLDNGDLLVTWQREFPLRTNWQGMESFYFYRSSDQGKSWHKTSELNPSLYSGLSGDKMGMPGMFVLPERLGEYPAGTILFAVCDWDINSSYCINIWRSSDQGNSWQWHGKLAPRGEDTVSGTGSVWEPEFIVGKNKELLCFYSDERQKGYDQCIAMEVSRDGGKTWNEYKILAGEYKEGWRRGVDPSLWRPGMPRVIKLKDGTYFMVYENIATENSGIITFRTSENGIDWGSITQAGTEIESGRYAAYQCPMLAYIDDGSTYGTIFVRGMNDTCSPSQLFVSSDKGNTWKIMDAPLVLRQAEERGSAWSGTFLTSGNKLIEINNFFNGVNNQIKCGSGILAGDMIIVDGANYRMRNGDTRLSLDDSGGSLDWGNKMILWMQNNLLTQSWKFHNIGKNFVLICNYSNLALDIKDGSMQAGLRVQQWDKNFSTAQQWEFVPVEDKFVVRNKRSGLVLDVENGSASEGNYVIQNYIDNTSTQKWKLERIFDVVQLIPYNVNDCLVYCDRNYNTIIANKSDGLEFESSLWRQIPALNGGAGFSFESVYYPKHYLRHYQGKLRVSSDDGSQIFKDDASWLAVDGLKGKDSNSLSLIPSNIAGNYMRHQDSYLKITPIVTELDRADATFYAKWQ